MRRPAKIPMEQVHRVHDILDKAPDVKPEAVTTRAAIGELCAPIARLRARGYSLRRIAEVLSANGIPITYETLSTYLAHSKRNRPATAGRDRGGKSKGTERVSREREPKQGRLTERRGRGHETQTSAKAVDLGGKVEPGPGASAGKRAERQAPTALWSFPTREDSSDM